jgi:hypothetical protein
MLFFHGILYTFGSLFHLQKCQQLCGSNCTCLGPLAGAMPNSTLLYVVILPKGLKQVQLYIILLVILPTTLSYCKQSINGDKIL